METIGLLIFIFFLHWFGDFVFQTHQMAENKSKSIYWLSLHVLYYCVAFVPICLVIETPTQYVEFMVLLFIGHWITDFFTSKLTTYFWQKKNVKAFFTTIGFDQFLHAVQLLLLYYIFVV